MSLHSAIAFAIAMLTLAASPGPGVFAVIAQAMSGGFRSAVAVIAGIVIGDLIFLALAIFGMSAIAHALGGLFIFVKIAGGAYLIFLGVRLWTARVDVLNSAPGVFRKDRRQRFIAGLCVTLSNPKVIVFYCGFLPTFMDLTQLTAFDIAVSAIIVAMALSAVLGIYAYSTARARRFFVGEHAARRFNQGAGTVLIGAGVAIASR